jgi:hypothetical protein
MEVGVSVASAIIGGCRSGHIVLCAFSDGDCAEVQLVAGKGEAGR